MRRWGGEQLLLALPVLFLVVFFYGPIANLLREGLTKDGAFSLEFLWTVLTDDYFRYVILFTLWQALLSTLASIALGLPLAFILTHYDFPLKRIVRALTIVPFVLPAITVALGFALLFGRNGYLNQLLMHLFGLSEPPLPIMYSLTGIVLAHAFYNAPIITRTVHAAWERLDPRYEESARALGASRFFVFKDITLPMILPGLLSGAALVFIFCFLSFPIVLSVGGGRFSTIEVEIYTRVVTRLDPQFVNYKIGAALALVGLVISLAVTYLYLRLQGRLGAPDGAAPAAAHRAALRRGQRPPAPDEALSMALRAHQRDPLCRAGGSYRGGLAARGDSRRGALDPSLVFVYLHAKLRGARGGFPLTSDCEQFDLWAWGDSDRCAVGADLRVCDRAGSATFGPKAAYSPDEVWLIRS
jgi:ABC-type Fe3+ transport system permease subunit